MTPVLKLFWNICTLKSGPEAVPTQGWFLVLLVLADLVMNGFVNTTFAQVSTLQASGYRAISLATTAVITWFVLYVRGLDGRFPGTLAALIGCDVVIGTLLAIALQISLVIDASGQSFMALLFNIWSVVVAGFILKRAINSTLSMGILMAFGMAFFGVVVGYVAIGPPG